jgi:hypothetical protein
MRQRPDSIVRWVTALGCLLCVGLVAGSLSAASGGLSETLGDIEWGDSREQVLEKLKSRMLDTLDGRQDLKHDRVKMQEARKEMLDRHARIAESYDRLEGKRTGYEVSVIAGEFTKNNGEALLKVNDEMAQRFYFFVDGDLYKRVVAYRQSAIEGVAFPAFVKRVAAKYGRPDEANNHTIDGEEKLHTVHWKDDETLLRVEDAREFFGTFKMVFSDRSKVESLRASEGAFGGSDKTDEEVSARVQDLTKGSAKGTSEEENVVDSMIGESVEVDLYSSTDDAEEENGSEETEDEESDDQKTAEASEQDDGSVDGVMESDEAKEDEKDEPLIIY